MDNYELLFLIVKYLRDGISPEAANLLEQELTSPARQLLPPRLDWTGAKHDQTFQDLERQFPHISGQHLVNITGWLSRAAATATGGTLKSLLSLPGKRNHAGGLTPHTLSVVSRHQLGLHGTRHQPGQVSQLPVYTTVYTRLQLQRRCLGHLSSVFCLLFDKSGHYVFTGADDLLVKMWGTYNGRLYFTFRGASAEISDMAVSDDNRLLAAGSTDKIIRVWCLLTAAPVAVLSKHTGTITALHFCPSAVSSVSPYLAATSGDGTVSFWKFQYKDKAKRKPIFDAEPTRYHEKMRPGGAQMICAAFSPGGLFLATGSVDHHVRVYCMEGREGPGKVLEQEAHTERVDSIQWSNKPRLRFVSGSKDGTARIWSFRAGCWNSSVLKATASDGRTVIFNKEKKCEEPLRVTMVNWSCDDNHVITAVSDCSLCVWTAEGGQLLHRLTSHQDEVYVLEPHPTFPNILMSGAHDGNLIIWDMSSSRVLFQHHNSIEPQGHGAIYDAKWCPDHLNIAASDSHGHVLFFSPNSKEAQGQGYTKCPEEMFFHTDYRPLLRDTAHYVLDEQTQCAPHLLPPPFLVDVEGNPYPADIQKQVPGREHLSDKELLVPNVSDNVSGPMSPPPRPRRPSSSAGRRSVDQPAQPDNVPAAAAGQAPVSNIDALIEELAANVPMAGSSEGGAGPSAGGGSPQHNPQSEHSYAEQEGGAAPASQQLESSVWRRRQLVGQELFKGHQLDTGRRKARGVDEKRFYVAEKEKGKVMFSEGAPVGFHEGVAVPTISGKTQQRRGNNRARAGGAAQNGRQAPAAAPAAPTARAANNRRDDHDDSSDDDEEDHDFNTDSVTDSSLTESDLEAPSGSASESSEYSDWGDNNLTPPQRTAKKSAKAAPSRPASSDDDEDDPKPGPSRNYRRRKYNFDPKKYSDIPKEYLPSAWLAGSIPKKSPYFPQMGDEVMYFRQGHMGYIGLVSQRKCYRLNMKEQTWKDRSDLGNVELVKVVGMKYEIRPPRLCCLKFAVIDQETGQLTGQKFSIKYHDMEDVVDFLVLRHLFDASMTVSWNPGDRYRCQIEDDWWYGTVLGVSPFDTNIPDSPFLSIQCLWDSGEEERLSPWDLDILPEGEIGQDKVEERIPVTKEEIERHIYQPLKEEWRGLDSKAECLRIAKGLEQLMALAHAENFNYPVDLESFPDYMLEIEYPMDFSLIKSRLDNHFYRRLTAVQFDVRYIATNAECYNRPKTEIVKCARVLTDLMLKIIQDPKISNVSREFHKLNEEFDWANTQEPSRKGSKKQQKTPPNPKQWKHDCMELLKKMFELPESEPFRVAVNEEEFPDYNRVITTPMDLTSVRESLMSGEYASPLAMQKEVNLVFSNSFQYNTNKNSPVLKMTKRLKEYFLDEFQSVITNWRKTNRRIGAFNAQKNRSPKSTPVKRTPSKKIVRKHDSDDDEEEEEKPKMKPERRQLQMSSEEENARRDKGKGKGKGKGKSSRIAKPPPKIEPKEESDEEEEEEDVPISRRRNPRNLRRNTDTRASRSSRRAPDISEESDEEEEEVEETPEETSEDDYEEENRRRKKRRSASFDPGEGSSRSVRPKRSAKAKVIRNRESDEEEEEEEKVPYRRRIVPKDSLPHNRRNMREVRRSALRRFQDGSDDDDEDHEETRRSPRKNVRRNRYQNSEGEDEEEEQRPRRTHRPVIIPPSEEEEEEDDQPPPPPPPSRRPLRTARAPASEPGPSSATVTISAADSSTDPPVRNVAPEVPTDEGSDHGEGPSHPVRPQRKRVKPLRLQEYEEDEPSLPPRQSPNKRRRTVERREDNRNERFRGEKRRRSGSERRSSRSARYEDESDHDSEEEEALSRRISKKNKNKRHSTGERRKSSNSDFMLSPKAKRSKATVNYKDKESDDSEEEEPLSVRKSKRSQKSNERSRRKSNYNEEESQSAEDEDIEESRSSRRSPSKKHSIVERPQRRRPAPQEEESEESEEEEESPPPRRRQAGARNRVEEQEEVFDEDQSEEDLGRRRGSRRRNTFRPQRNNSRPQRSSGQTSRDTYREPSTDDDVIPKRHHRQRHLNRSRGEDDNDDNQEGPGVSRSGRLRRPNPRLLD